MWKIISFVSTARRECCVVLTTHNMEEAEALCSRIGIMVGGQLRCIGSNQHLKARFGRGYQLELRIGAHDAIVAAEAATNWCLPTQLHVAEVQHFCSQLGKPDRGKDVRPGCERGRIVYEMLAREGFVPAATFIEWWLLEDRVDSVSNFLLENFPGTVMLERHDRTFRYRLPADAKLSMVFSLLEKAKGKLAIEEYGVSQASLEQIFNGFAAQQEEGPSAAENFGISDGAMGLPASQNSRQGIELPGSDE